MPRIALFSIGVALVVAACTLGPTNYAFAAVAALGMAGIALALAYLFRGKNPANAFNLFLLAIGTAAVIGAGVLLLSYLGPLGALLLAAAMIVVPVYISWRRGDRRRERRALAGLCTECGYDLRESPNACPECGAGIPEALARRRRLFAAHAKPDAVEASEATVAGEPGDANSGGN